MVTCPKGLFQNPGERFPRRCRLRKREEFKHAFAEGRKITGFHFRIVVCQNSLGYPRLGLAVSRRVGNSVVRNRTKRRIRELFRRNRHRFPISADIVVIPFVAAPTLSFDCFRERFFELLDRHSSSRRGRNV